MKALTSLCRFWTVTEHAARRRNVLTLGRWGSHLVKALTLCRLQILDRYDTQLDEDELLALVHHWDSERDGVIKYEEFLKAIFES